MAVLRLLYGTGNPAKLDTMRRILQPLDIELDGLNDIKQPIPEVTEDGNDPLENAIIKAKAYWEAFKRPVFSCDSGLYIDGLPETQQPGVNIRRVNNHRMSDDEMTEYYSALAVKLGGRAMAQYHNAICFILSETEIYSQFTEDLYGSAFYLVAQPHPKQVVGFPLDRISVQISSGMYYYDLPVESASKNNINLNYDKGFQNFFKCSLKID